jgi:hypothetical protein
VYAWLAHMYIHIEALGLARNGMKVMEKPLVFRRK